MPFLVDIHTISIKYELIVPSNLATENDRAFQGSSCFRANRDTHIGFLELIGRGGKIEQQIGLERNKLNNRIARVSCPSCIPCMLPDVFANDNACLDPSKIPDLHRRSRLKVAPFIEHIIRW